jgi:hypothetical protein
MLRFLDNHYGGLKRNLAVAARIFVIALFVISTNSGFVHRISVIFEQGNWSGAIGFIGVWGMCLAALLIAAFQPTLWIRAPWAVASVSTKSGAQIWACSM